MRTKTKPIRSIVIVVSLFIILCPSLVLAESDNGNPAVVHLDFEVRVQGNLHLRIGSAGATIDEVGFDVTDIPEVQPTVAGDLAPEVRVGAQVGDGDTITLSADSSTDMVGAVTAASMPFSTLDCTGTGDFNSVSALAFDGTANQTIWQDTGRGFRTGTFSFNYTNSYLYPPDTYNGQVTYTLTSP